VGAYYHLHANVNLAGVLHIYAYMDMLASNRLYSHTHIYGFRNSNVASLLVFKDRKWKKPFTVIEVCICKRVYKHAACMFSCMQAYNASLGSRLLIQMVWHESDALYHTRTYMHVYNYVHLYTCKCVMTQFMFMVYVHVLTSARIQKYTFVPTNPQTQICLSGEARHSYF
jgi:hypothetical protein